MSETPQPTTQTPRPRRWQLRLRTLVLLLAVVAVWMTFFINRRRIDWLESRIAAMRPLTRELVIDDEAQIAVVKLEELWFDENQWDVYLPAGTYRLCLATREIEQSDLAPVVASRTLEAGRHRLALEQERTGSGWRVVVTSDRTGSILVEESEEWDPGHGSTGGGQFSRSEQRDPDQPVVLFRRIFSRTTGPGRFGMPNEPAEGVLLWIEPL